MCNLIQTQRHNDQSEQAKPRGVSAHRFLLTPSRKRYENVKHTKCGSERNEHQYKFAVVKANFFGKRRSIVNIVRSFDVNDYHSAFLTSYDCFIQCAKETTAKNKM